MPSPHNWNLIPGKKSCKQSKGRKKSQGLGTPQCNPPTLSYWIPSLPYPPIPLRPHLLDQWRMQQVQQQPGECGMSDSSQNKTRVIRSLSHAAHLFLKAVSKPSANGVKGSDVTCHAQFHPGRAICLGTLEIRLGWCNPKPHHGRLRAADLQLPPPVALEFTFNRG